MVLLRALVRGRMPTQNERFIPIEITRSVAQQHGQDVWPSCHSAPRVKAEGREA
jgi:hypothetical protein